MDSRQHQADKIYRTTSIGTENQQIKINKYENQIHFILINRGLSIGIMCHTESRLFHGPETGYRRASLEPAGNPDTSRRQDFHTGQQQRPLINEPFQPSDHIPTDWYDIRYIQ